MQPYWATHFLLPDQQHSQGRAVLEAIEQARQQTAALVGCEPFELVFTGGGTEANNLGVLGGCEAGVHAESNSSAWGENSAPEDGHRDAAAHPRVAEGESTAASGRFARGHVLAGPAEHDSVQAALDRLLPDRWTVERIPCDRDGLVDPDDVSTRIRPETRLICVQLANESLGVIQPIREITAVAHRHGLWVHCDATAAAGRIAVDLGCLDVDSASLSGHRFYGPKGSGALFLRRGRQLRPQRMGEPREMGVRPGAENVPAIIGMGAAASMAAKCLEEAYDNLQMLRERMISALQRRVPGGFTPLFQDAPRTPGTLCLLGPVDARQIQSVARHLVFSVPGRAQPHDAMRRSFAAVGMPDAEVRRVLHFSFGWTTSREQVDQAADSIAAACGQ